MFLMRGDFMSKQNKYDDETFYSAYENMTRSVKGLEGAGEWHIFKEMLPNLHDKHVLDLGCGFGWHCRFAREQRAKSVIGIDISQKMLDKATDMTDDNAITYLNIPIEDFDFSNHQFNVVMSSLTLHYIKSFTEVCQKVYATLTIGGTFVFSVEHPIFTSRPEQEWYVDDQAQRLHWPVDHYQTEGVRETEFLTEQVIKYHRTISTYMNALIKAGFTIRAVEESKPSDDMLDMPGMKDENRRPMFLMIAAEKLT